MIDTRDSREGFWYRGATGFLLLLDLVIALYDGTSMTFTGAEVWIMFMVAHIADNV